MKAWLVKLLIALGLLALLYVVLTVPHGGP